VFMCESMGGSTAEGTAIGSLIRRTRKHHWAEHLAMPRPA
jgi:hypothetical protein